MRPIFLSGLSRLKGGEETFLLVSAALANLTFMSPVTSTAMRQNATVKILVKAVRAAPFTTLFAKDQVSKAQNLGRTQNYNLIRTYESTQFPSCQPEHCRVNARGQKE